MIQQYPKDNNSCSANFYLALAFTDNNESCLVFSLKFLFRKIIFVSFIFIINLVWGDVNCAIWSLFKYEPSTAKQAYLKRSKNTEYLEPVLTSESIFVHSNRGRFGSPRIRL